MLFCIIKWSTFSGPGFYFLNEGKLQVGPYQGSLACINLPENTGVCWAAINNQETVIVENVHNFPGHIACDSRSKSEIVIPIRDKNGIIIGVLDVDSSKENSFDIVDKFWLERIIRAYLNLIISFLPEFYGFSTIFAVKFI